MSANAIERRNNKKWNQIIRLYEKITSRGCVYVKFTFHFNKKKSSLLSWSTLIQLYILGLTSFIYFNLIYEREKMDNIREIIFCEKLLGLVIFSCVSSSKTCLVTDRLTHSLTLSFLKPFGKCWHIPRLFNILTMFRQYLGNILTIFQQYFSNISTIF